MNTKRNIGVAIMVLLIAGCRPATVQTASEGAEIVSYMLKVQYADGRPVPFASVVVGDPQTAGGAFMPDKNGCVRVSLAEGEAVTVMTDGFPPVTIDRMKLDGNTTNLVTVK